MWGVKMFIFSAGKVRTEQETKHKKPDQLESAKTITGNKPSQSLSWAIKKLEANWDFAIDQDENLWVQDVGES